VHAVRTRQGLYMFSCACCPLRLCNSCGV